MPSQVTVNTDSFCIVIYQPFVCFIGQGLKKITRRTTEAKGVYFLTTKYNTCYLYLSLSIYIYLYLSISISIHLFCFSIFLSLNYLMSEATSREAFASKNHNYGKSKQHTT